MIISIQIFNNVVQLFGKLTGIIHFIQVVHLDGNIKVIKSSAFDPSSHNSKKNMLNSMLFSKMKDVYCVVSLNYGKMDQR